LILNLFYQEPDPDRWLPLDRYPRRAIRRIVRGKRLPGGQMMVFINLVKGLDKLGVPYRVNDFRYARGHPEELACIVGKPHVLFERRWENPVLFGASIFSHPLACPDLLERYPVKRVLVPGEWMRDMCEPYYGDAVKAWPVGVDTDFWAPSGQDKDIDCLVYDKILWHEETRREQLLNPLVRHLQKLRLNIAVVRRGFYKPEDYQSLLGRSKCMVFLCEHETQGLAYQEALASGIPVFAWDREGVWEDPDYYPDRVEYSPVSSVPYWSDACGMKFRDLEEGIEKWGRFWERVNSLGESDKFEPRDFILSNLTLEKAASAYLSHVHDVVDSF